jgi:hypothetical protein
MKNFRFDPYDHFPKRSKVIDETLTVSEIIKELEKTKNAEHKLSMKEEQRRNVLTFNLFKLIENYQTSQPFERELSHEEKKDVVIMSERIARFKKEPSTGIFSSLRKSIPTRYHKKFIHICLKTGYGLQGKYSHKKSLAHYCNEVGFPHEYQALREYQEFDTSVKKSA